MKNTVIQLPSALESRLGKSMFISGLCKPLSMVLSYIYVPVVMSYLGVEKYGIWATILTILSWLHYFDIGIGNGLRNRLTESIGRKDGKGKELISSAYVIIAVIMSCIAIGFALIASFVNWERIFGVKDVKENLYSVVTISFLFVALNFVLSLCRTVLYSLQEAGQASIADVATQIINLFSLIIVSNHFESNLFMMSVICGLSMIIVNIIVSIILFFRHKELCPSIKSVNIESGKSISKLGLQFFIVQICALILFTTDSIIISYLYGAAEVTPYSTVNKVFNIVISIFTAILTPTWSYITKANTEGEKKKIIDLLHNLHKLMSVFFIATILLALVFRPLSNWWLSIVLDYTDNLIIFGALYCILTIWCNTNSYFTNAMEIMRIPRIVAIVQAAINIPLSLFFAEVLGLRSAGVLIGTVLTMFIPAVVLPMVVSKALNKEKK